MLDTILLSAADDGLILVVGLFVFGAIVVLLAFYLDTDHSVAGRIDKAKTAEELAQLIDGTTWHFTDPLGEMPEYPPFWYTLSFNSGKVTMCMAKPNKGKWSSLDPVEYEIKEKRYGDIIIYWFILPDMLFVLRGCDINKRVDVMITQWTEQGEQKYYSFPKLGDCNPWD